MRSRVKVLRPLLIPFERRASDVAAAAAAADAADIDAMTKAAGSKFNPILAGNWRGRYENNVDRPNEKFLRRLRPASRWFDAATNMRINNGDVVGQCAY